MIKSDLIDGTLSKGGVLKSNKTRCRTNHLHMMERDTLQATMHNEGVTVINIFVPIMGCMLSRFSHVQLFVTPWTVACHTPLSMGFSRQEYWSGCHALLQGIFNPGIEPRSPALQADSLPPELPGKPCL